MLGRARSGLLTAFLSLAPLAPAHLGPAGLAAQGTVSIGRACGPEATVRIVVPHGAVRITTWTRDSIVVRGRLDASAGKLTLEGTTDALRLGLVRPEGARGLGLADLEIVVPRNVRLWFTASSASLDYAAEGGELTAVTTGGRVRVTGTVRVAVVETLDGNVELGVTARSARLRTATGTIVARGVVQELDASSVSGPLLIGMEGPIQQARLESTSAAISFKGDLHADGRLVAETHGGDVDLRLSPRLEATWLLVNWGGILDNQLVPATVVRPVGKKGEWRFITGRGTARVEVRTFKGTILLQPRPLER
jgi:hypothetical protein